MTPRTRSVFPAHRWAQPLARVALMGRWLLVTRLGFVGLFAIVLGLNVAAIPDLYHSQITPQLLLQARQASVPLGAFIIFTMVVSILPTVCSLAVAALLAWRRSEEWIALFCAVTLVVFGGVAANSLDVITGGAMPQLVASVTALRLLVRALIVTGQVAFVAFFFIFPSGRFAPRWLRWVLVLYTVYWVGVAFIPGWEIGQQGSLLAIFLVIAVIAQVYRYRRVSTSVERAQTKWVIAGFALAVLIIVIPLLVQLLAPPAALNFLGFNGFAGQQLLTDRWFIALILFPICIAVAVTRSRLWDIDVLINRTLVYGSLTAILAALYFSLVIGAQTLIRLATGQAGQSQLLVVLSTLLVAALIQPLRRWLQAIIDRRFYRRKYDAAGTLERFGATLRSEVELDDLNDHLLAVVEETMHPARVSLWLLPQARQGGLGMYEGREN